jgi:hypothetical protein
MAQQFLADAQDLTAGVVITTTSETTGPQTNPIPLPFQNGKFRILASCIISVGTNTTSLLFRIRRNPSAENLVVNTGSNNITVTAGNNVEVTIACVDAVPDGRSCQYAVTVVQNGATGNGTFLSGSHIEAVAMSG